MFICRSLTGFLSKWSSYTLDSDLDGLVTSIIVPLQNECVIQTLQTQHQDGSWGKLGPSEETAYAILTLVNFLSLPIPPGLNAMVIESVHRGREFLRLERCCRSEFLWI